MEYQRNSIFVTYKKPNQTAVDLNLSSFRTKKVSSFFDTAVIKIKLDAQSSKKRENRETISRFDFIAKCHLIWVDFAIRSISNR